MRKRIFISIFVTAVFAMSLAIAIIIPILYQSFVAENRKALVSESHYIATAMKSLDNVTYLKNVGVTSNDRITLIAPDGTVLYDNQYTEDTMENHKDRPEFQGALENGTGEDSRLSSTLSESTYYYALRLDDGNVLRMANTTRNTLGVFGSTASIIAFLLIALLIATSLVANGVSKAILTPINRLNLDVPLKNKTYDELSPLLLRLDRQHTQIQAQIQEISAKQHEFNQITDSMPDGLVIFNHDGHVLSTNSSARSFFKGGIFTGSYLELCRDSRFIALIEGVLKGTGGSTSMKHGNRVYALTASPVVEEGGTHAAVLFINDITERENAEKMRQEFSANVSHELKTPLTSIMGYAEIMANGIMKQEDIPRFSQKIHHEASRLLTLIQDIIRLSSLDESTMTEAFEPVDLYTTAQCVVENLQKKADGRGVALRLRGHSLTIDGLAPTLYEMLFNLVDNAIVYNNQGGQVTITLQKNYNQPMVTIADDGIGIPPEEHDRIFERFYRVDKSRSKETGGTGLGLSIVKHGALLHHADLSLTSTPGEGTVFTLTFSAKA